MADAIINKNLASDVKSLNSDLSNEITARTELGAHNLLYNRVKASTIVGGLSIQPNSDGSLVVAAGTASSSATLLISGSGTSNWGQAEQTLPKGTYKISTGGVGSANTVYIRVAVEGQGDFVAYGDVEPTFTIVGDTRIVATLIVVNGGVIASPITVKPMVRLATDTDPTYQPYAKTNRELTENEPQISLNGNGSTFELKTIIIDDVCIFALKFKKTATTYSICQCPLPLADEEIVGRVNINGTTADVAVLQATNQGVLQVRATTTDSNWRYVSGVYRIA